MIKEICGANFSIRASKQCKLSFQERCQLLALDAHLHTESCQCLPKIHNYSSFAGKNYGRANPGAISSAELTRAGVSIGDVLHFTLNAFFEDSGPKSALTLSK
eukprot:scaffold188603_cov13-Tisochrysis_lutea.AAC.1